MPNSVSILKVEELRKHLMNKQSVRKALEQAMGRPVNAISLGHNHLTPQVYREKGKENSQHTTEFFFSSPNAPKFSLLYANALGLQCPKREKKRV